MNEIVDAQLTGREQLVMHWVTLGYSSKYVGNVLGISPRTVETHLRNVYAKLRVNSRDELIDISRGVA